MLLIGELVCLVSVVVRAGCQCLPTSQSGDTHLYMSLGPDPSHPPEGTAPADPPAAAGEDHYEDDGRSAAGVGSETQSAPVSAPADPFAPATAAPAQPGRVESPNMLPARFVRRSPVERILVRLIATCGIVGIGVAIAAIMVHSKSQGWLVGLVVAIVSVVLSAILWSSRQL